jgi:hypothetical protein
MATPEPTTDAVVIEVIGGYDEPFDVDIPPRPLPADVEQRVRAFTSQKQVADYLRQLPDDCLDVHRHIQWRFLPDGAFGQTSGCAYIHRPLPEWRSLEAADVWAFGESRRNAAPGGEVGGGA